MHYTQRVLSCWLFVSLYAKHEFEMYLEIHVTTSCCPGDLTSETLDNLYLPANVMTGKRGQISDMVAVLRKILKSVVDKTERPSSCPRAACVCSSLAFIIFLLNVTKHDKITMLE